MTTFSSSGSVCYQDSYPGGYRRYGCGAYSDAASVATTYAGQKTPYSMQVIYTALSLATTGPASVTNGPPSSTLEVVTVGATSTVPVITATVAALEATGQDDRPQAGIIAGGVVGGLSFTVAILAVACFFLRRRQRISKQEIGGIRTMKDTMSDTGSIQVIKDTSSIRFVPIAAR
jgi:hypothetical protein